VQGERSHHHLSDPLRSAQDLKQVLAERFPLPTELATPIQRSLELLFDSLTSLQTQIATVEGWITEQAADQPQVSWLDSLPGVGLVTAAGIVAEIGNLERFAQVKV